MHSASTPANPTMERILGTPVRTGELQAPDSGFLSLPKQNATTAPSPEHNPTLQESADSKQAAR